MNNDHLKELISNRMLYVNKSYFDLPETDWEDGFNCALRFELEFLQSLHNLLGDSNDRKENPEDHDVGC